MEEILLAALSAAGAVTFWWRSLRRRRTGAAGALPPHDEEIEIALHVAAHTARSRGQDLAADHLLFALLQAESVAGAIRATGGDPDAIEDAVLAALDRGDEDDEPGASAVALAFAIARHNRRPAAPADLWFGLLRASRRARDRIAPAADPTAVLFALAHGVAERDLPAVQPGEVELVLVNDDFSPQELVVEVLRDGLGLPAGDANRLMLKTHHEGRASLGRRPGSEAERRTRAALAVARARGFPLLIRLVPGADKR